LGIWKKVRQPQPYCPGYSTFGGYAPFPVRAMLKREDKVIERNELEHVEVEMLTMGE
jgi:hypothetical protein